MKVGGTGKGCTLHPKMRQYSVPQLETLLGAKDVRGRQGAARWLLSEYIKQRKLWAIDSPFWELGTRTRNVLKNAGIISVAMIDTRSDRWFLGIPNCGIAVVHEIRECAAKERAKPAAAPSDHETA